MKWIVTLGLFGWAGIVALGWKLADARLGSLCHDMPHRCDPKLVAQRDAVLTNGLTVALVALLALALAGWLRRERLKAPAPRAANQAGPRKIN